jgi:dolichol-phosphate mannosyltransferase
MDKLVIIPTYNERENIVSILQAVLALAGDFHILVVDDSSPDQTAQLVRDLSTSFPGRVFFLERK